MGNFGVLEGVFLTSRLPGELEPLQERGADGCKRIENRGPI